MSDDELFEELGRACEGLTFMSESDYPVEPVRWDGSVTLSHERLRELAGLPPGAPVGEVSVGDFFRVAAGEQEWKGEAELATAGRFQRLVRLLEGNLEELKVYRLGEINLRVYAVGRARGGGWLGVQTRVVET